MYVVKHNWSTSMWTSLGEGGGGREVRHWMSNFSSVCSNSFSQSNTELTSCAGIGMPSGTGTWPWS